MGDDSESASENTSIQIGFQLSVALLDKSSLEWFSRFEIKCQPNQPLTLILKVVLELKVLHECHFHSPGHNYIDI